MSLAVAALNGETATVHALLAAGGIDVNHAGATGYTALIFASNRGHTEIVHALLAEDGIDANHTTDNGSTALIRAAHNGHAAVVRALLAVVGIAVNHASKVGFTALFFASMEGHAEIVRTLLAVDGINANHANNTGFTALISASSQGHAEVVRALLTAGGTDVNHATTTGFTALMMAVSQNHTSCVRALVAARGVNLNEQSTQCGNVSMLHMACTQRSAELAELLLLAGSCRFLLDDDGYVPLDHADGDKGVVAVFASGVDYWQRKRHGGHSWTMREAITALLLVRQRLGARAAVALVPAPAAQGRVLRSATVRPKAKAKAPAALPHLPEEIWLGMCCFLRGADFVP